MDEKSALRARLAQLNGLIKELHKGRKAEQVVSSFFAVQCLIAYLHSKEQKEERKKWTGWSCILFFVFVASCVMFKFELQAKLEVTTKLDHT